MINQMFTDFNWDYAESMDQVGKNWHLAAKSLQSCPTLCDPMAAHQDPLSLGFSRQESWSGLPFPLPGDLPNPGIKPRSPALWADSLPSEPPDVSHICIQCSSISSVEECKTLFSLQGKMLQDILCTISQNRKSKSLFLVQSFKSIIYLISPLLQCTLLW